MDWVTAILGFYGVLITALVWVGFRGERKPENDGFLPGIGRSDER